MEIALDKLGKIITGNTPSKKNKDYWDSKDIVFIKPNNLNIYNLKLFEKDNEYLSEKAINKARTVDANSILVTCIGIVGKVALTTSEKTAFNQQINAIVPNKNIFPKYLAYALMYCRPRLASIANAPVVPIINKKQFSNFKVNVNLNKIDQITIVKQLDVINKIIENKNEQLNKLDELIKARFVEMFGDPISNNKSLSLKEFREICDLKAGDFTPAKQIFKVQDPINQYPCYGGNGIRGFVSNYTHDGKYVLIGRQGALCGNVKLASGKFKNTEHAILVNPKIPINVFWLFELLDLEKLNRFKSGAAQPGLAVKTLNKILIPNVDLECQNEFANFVQQVDKSKFENIVYLNKMLLMKILSQLGDVSRD